MSGKSSRSGGLAGSCVGSGGVGEAIGICMPGVITCPGLGEGDAVGICIPGVITCPGLGEGDAVGICMPGVITCGGEGEGFGFTTLLAGGLRRVRAGVLFFLGAALGLGFGMLCISCWGNPLTLIANTNAIVLSIRNAFLLLTIQFISPLWLSPRSERTNAS